MSSPTEREIPPAPIERAQPVPDQNWIGDASHQYSAKGWCRIDAGVEPAELTMLQTICDQLLADGDQPVGRFHDIELGADRRFLRHRHVDQPALEHFVLSGNLTTVARSLLGTDPYLFNEHFVVKGPRTGARFAWHQDSAYVGFDHCPYLTLWIALDDITDRNGCLEVIESRPDEATIVAHTWHDGGKELVGRPDEEPGVPVKCSAGTIIAFSSLTLHRSGPNLTDRPRRAHVVQYSPEPIIDPATGAAKHFARLVPASPAS